MKSRVKITASFAAAVLTACAPPAPKPAPAAASPQLALTDAPTPPRKHLNLPARQPDAMPGSVFLERTKDLAPGQREEAIIAEVLGGNVPSFLRTLVPVTLAARDTWNRKITAIAWVLPDYLAIGSDADFIRMPMNGETALYLAHELNLTLPTDRIVDAVFAQANVRLTPRSLPPGSDMTSSQFFATHHRMIQDELAAQGLRGNEGKLTAGHKKDLIQNRTLLEHPDRLVIYGWHKPDGHPTQPVSDVHGARYADYSHGVRFVSRYVNIDGRMTTLEAALADIDQARVFSKEGRIEDASAAVFAGY
jgi:hypothetical protein